MKAGAGASDAFGGMFGQDKGPKKTKSVIHPVKCTLEELFNGKSTRIKITRDRICKKCDGKGGESLNNQKCQRCGGSGKRKQQQFIGPGMFKDEMVICDACNGVGEIIPESNKCKWCLGKRIIKEKKVIECVIDKGAPDGEKFTFHGEADEAPDKEAGNVVFVVS